MRWEYLIYDATIAMQDDFNRLGRDGWELVCCADDGLKYVFKRPVKA